MTDSFDAKNTTYDAAVTLEGPAGRGFSSQTGHLPHGGHTVLAVGGSLDQAMLRLKSVALDDLSSHAGMLGHREGPVLKARQRLLGRFEITRPLGEGGMGEVYLARDDVLNRMVAIKTLRVHPGFQTTLPWLQMFRREASSTAQLQHPNITTLHDFGFAEGVPFLVLEYLQGHSLHDVIQKGRMPVARVLTLIRQLLDALAHAHAQGVVHRDLKPGNLFVEPGDHLKVMDFGVALMQQDPATLKETFGRSAHSLNQHLGVASPVAGTPLYMPPEQLMGGEQDARTDLWALGVVLFEMLTGQRPFSDRTQALSQAAPPVSAYRDDVPDALLMAVTQCLRRDPADRPESAAALKACLDVLETPISLSAPATITNTNVVLRHDVFVGRETQLQSLDAWVQAGRRIINIVGPAGSGKTRLASTFAHHTRRHFEGTFICPLADATTQDAVVVAVARVLNISVTRGDIAHVLSEAMSRRDKLLLVLDNVEQVIDPVATLLRRWMVDAPDVVFVLTSRHHLGVLDEAIFELGPLALPHDDSAEEVAASEAVKLFVERARAHVPRFKVTSHNRADVAALVRLLDGLPLALELAAARVRVLTPAKMRARMHQRFDWLTTRQQGVDDRQATLLQALEWSWDLLELHEQAALAQASFFEGGFTLDAAEAVIDLDAFEDAPFVVDVIEALLDKSLVQRQWSGARDDVFEEPRFELLLSVQAFAHRRLKKTELVAQRHSTYFSHFGRVEAIDRLHSRGGIERLRALAQERSNLLKASHGAISSDHADVAIRAVAALCEVLSLEGPLATGFDLITQALETLTLTLAQRGALLSRRGTLGSTSGVNPNVREDLSEALDIARRLGQRRQEGITRGTLALLDHMQGHVDDAHRGYMDALNIAQQLGDGRREAIHLGNLAILDKQQGRYDQARDRYQRAHAMALILGNHRSACIHMINLASLDALLGDHNAAYQQLLNARKLARRVNYRRIECHCLGELGRIDHTCGRLSEARTHFEAAIDAAQALNDGRSEAVFLSAMASLDSQQNRVGDAMTHAQRAESLLRQLKDQRQLALALARRGLINLRCADPDAARAARDEAQQIADRIEAHDAEDDLVIAINELNTALRHSS